MKKLPRIQVLGWSEPRIQELHKNPGYKPSLQLGDLLVPYLIMVINHLLRPWKLTWQTGKSPCSTGNTSTQIVFCILLSSYFSENVTGMIRSWWVQNPANQLLDDDDLPWIYRVLTCFNHSQVVVWDFVHQQYLFISFPPPCSSVIPPRPEAKTWQLFSLSPWRALQICRHLRSPRFFFVKNKNGGALREFHLKYWLVN